jgi:hypothetical protein
VAPSRGCAVDDTATPQPRDSRSRGQSGLRSVALLQKKVTFYYATRTYHAQVMLTVVSSSATPSCRVLLRRHGKHRQRRAVGGRLQCLSTFFFVGQSAADVHAWETR